MNTTARKTTRCLCSQFEFGTTVQTGQDLDFIGHDTQCGRDTNRTFAQGHDAKLASFLVAAEMAGLEIRRGEVTYAGAVNAARVASDKLADKVATMLVKAHERAAKKATRKTVKKAEAATVSPEPELAAAPTTREATIKVGRWTYPATIDIATGEAIFARKLGGTKTVKSGEYSEV